MTSESLSTSPNTSDISRREAIKRAALVLGFALSPSLVRGVLGASAPAAAAGPERARLTTAQRAIATAAAERILPRTETPGATDVGVTDFIDLMYGAYLPDDEKARLTDGLARLDTQSQAAHQKGFAAISAEQQDGVLRGLAESSDPADSRCFQQLRELTVLGYFTSEKVGKTVLKYDPVPGRYDPCIPLSETEGKAWYMS